VSAGSTDTIDLAARPCPAVAVLRGACHQCTRWQAEESHSGVPIVAARVAEA
jgi:hypothetical protein